jgi:hypothetical protein
MFGLSLVLTGARRTSRRGSDARRGLVQSHNETDAVREDRDELIGQREAARTETATALVVSSPSGGGPLNPDDGRQNGRHRVGHRAAARQEAASASADSWTSEHAV